MNLTVLTTLLAFTAAASVAPPVDGDSLTELKQIVHESNQCLLNEVSRRVDEKRTNIGSEEVSAIRMAAANACYRYNEQLAKFSKPYLDGSKSLKEATDEMLVGSIGIANAYIATRVKLNAANAR